MQQLSHVQLIPQLINSLADEKVRWQDTVENLDYKINNITGDVLVAAGFVAYLGPFTVSVQHCLQGARLTALLSWPLAVAGQICWEKGLGQKGARSLLDHSLRQRQHRIPFQWKQDGLDAHSRLVATKRKAMIVLLMAGTLPHSTVQGVAEAAVRKQHSSHQGAKPDQHPWRPHGNPLLAGKLEKNPTLQAEGASGKG